MSIEKLCPICHKQIGRLWARKKLKMYCWGAHEEQEL